MSSKKVKKVSAGGTRRQPESRALADFPVLQEAVASFVEAHCCLQSSVVAKLANEAASAATTPNELFETLLRQRVFDFSEALLLTFFLSQAPAIAAEEGEEPFGAGEKLDIAAAYSTIAEVYDLGASDAVDAHFGGDGDSETDESDSDGQSGSEGDD